jgi:hypothetical protein
MRSLEDFYSCVVGHSEIILPSSWLPYLKVYFWKLHQKDFSLFFSPSSVLLGSQFMVYHWRQHVVMSQWVNDPLTCRVFF